MFDSISSSPPNRMFVHGERDRVAVVVVVKTRADDRIRQNVDALTPIALISVSRESTPLKNKR